MSAGRSELSVLDHQLLCRATEIGNSTANYAIWIPKDVTLSNTKVLQSRGACHQPSMHDILWGKGAPLNGPVQRIQQKLSPGFRVRCARFSRRQT
ncbi:hypothetical protein Misp04_09120 [Micromonospora sp. NBRC 101691]|nr:hypothetical protein Misp04_09120 [Micromonospora sp. NBRC 101691]